MRKRILLLLILMFFVSIIKVNAAPDTYQRTKKNLRLPKNIDVSKVDADEVMKIPAVNPKAKIYDFADLLTEAEESQIFIQLNEYINHTGFDAIIITTNDIKDLELKDYTYKFYDFNNFLENGVTFVIYNNGDKKSIYMGNNGPYNSDIFNVYSNNIVTEILKRVYTSHINKDDYIGACNTYISLIDSYYLQAYGSYRENVESKSLPWIEMIVIAFVLTFIIIVLIVTKNQKKPTRGDLSVKNALNNNSMIVKCEYDNPVSEKSVNDK